MLLSNGYFPLLYIQHGHQVTRNVTFLPMLL